MARGNLRTGRWAVAFAAALLLVAGLTYPKLARASASDHTRDEAVAYLYSMEGNRYDYNGNGVTDCPDLAKEYYEWLGEPVHYGDGYTYVTYEPLPDGWVRVYDDPEPGDVAAWGTWFDREHKYGHVAMVVSVSESGVTYIEQSSSANVAARLKTYSSSPDCYLRPNFKGNHDPVGHVDSITAGMGTVTVSGWAYDPDDVWATTGIHVYVGGPVGSGAWGNPNTVADQPSEDVERNVGVPGNHRFNATIEVPVGLSGDQGVYVYATNAAGEGGSSFLDGDANGTTVSISNYSLPNYDYGAAVALPEGDGTYTIASSLDPRLFVEVAGSSTEAYANVQLWGGWSDRNRLWEFRRNADGTYTIANAVSGMVLDVQGASLEGGANVIQHPDNGGGNQHFWVQDCGDGTYALKANHSRGFLDVTDAVAADGTNIQQCQGNGNSAQKFIISKSHGLAATLPEGDGLYRVECAADRGLRLDVAGASLEDDANVQVHEANATLAQVFRFASNGDGSYSIANACSGRLLDVMGESRADGANVQQHGTEWALNRSWWLEDLGDGSYAIKAVHSGRCLDVADAVIASGTNVQQWRANGTVAQRWAIVPADTTPPAISDVEVSDVSAGGYTVTCSVTDDVGVDRVTFPTWTVRDGQDDLLDGREYDDGYLGVRDGDRWSFRVSASDHGGEVGQYLTHIYAWDAAGNVAKVGGDSTVLVAVGDAPDLSRDGWADLPGGAKGYVRNGTLVTGWLDLDGSKYFFQPDGAMSVGWTDVEVSGKPMHYYFNPASGNLVRDTWFEIDGQKYYFRPSGNLATGWATIADGGVDKKYYLDESGQLLTGWQDIEVGGKLMHYYFRPSGSMATGWATIDGQKYWFRPSGNMATGFADVDDAFKRYFDQDGRMLTGWQQIGSNTYYFRASGAMQTGTATIDGVAYTFTDKGVMAW